MTDDQLAWAVRREDAELAQRLDAVVAAWQREGFVEQVMDLWIPVRKLTRPGADPR